jgi:hypothetical protein
MRIRPPLPSAHALGAPLAWTCKIDISHGGEEDALFLGVRDVGDEFTTGVGA